MMTIKRTVGYILSEKKIHTHVLKVLSRENSLGLLNSVLKVSKKKSLSKMSEVCWLELRGFSSCRHLKSYGYSENIHEDLWTGVSISFVWKCMLSFKMQTFGIFIWTWFIHPMKCFPCSRIHFSAFLNAKPAGINFILE